LYIKAFTRRNRSPQIGTKHILRFGSVSAAT